MITSHSITATIAGLDLVLEPISAEITVDEGWAPYVQVRMVCPIEDTAQLVALDPREPRRAIITAKQEFGRTDRLRDISRRFRARALRAISTVFSGGPVADISRSLYWDWTTPGAAYQAPLTRTFDLGLRSRVLDHVAGTITLTFASDEALLQDNAHVSTIPLYVPATNVFGAVQYVLNRIGTALYESSAGEAATPFDPAKNVWKPGQSAWDWLAPIVQAADIRLWCDERRRWRLTPASIAAGDTIALTAADHLTRATDSISRDEEFYKGVLVTYEWADAEGKQQTAYDLAYTPPWIPSTQQRIKRVTIRRTYPGPGAAKRLLRAALTRGRVIQVTAISQYVMNPGRPVTISLPSTPLQSGFAAAVAFQFPGDEMTVRMRELADAGEIENEYTPIPEEEA